ncbi:anhydro-N-acetylmuramic acid kinase [Enhygromyxa salina]|uniref:Anhydro-N-acetylmuramic acid kinase n=1 Tax=Enhygromyxa salina TaxID=215803 RepID=A0A2S9XUX2_9BACT|nr:GNAT family N-acetyltransferase [Enhygromyxa salina]PRP96511.1 anhydro-N-acetylmuramic acid kinase [Enhygromyxa salina]
MYQTFETPRMWLRPVEEADLDELVALDADPEVMRYISGGQPNPRSVYERELLPRMRAWVGRPFGYFSAFAGSEAGAFLGWFHLRPSVFDDQILELGYRLRREVWGRGLATEGSRVLLEHAFTTLGQTAVDACAMPENAASIAVMRRCGMQYLGMFTHPRVNMELARYIVRRDS